MVEGAFCDNYGDLEGDYGDFGGLTEIVPQKSGVLINITIL